ncbi:MAG: glutamine synthetase, partial [Lachnospiraceae bacterium]|nr:glutamine synthetase [Lachnospiraceae bacterium]
THENAGYFDVGPIDVGENARRDMVLTLEDMGFVVEASHHDVAPAQHEISFRFDEAMATADNIMTFKMAIKTIARRHGLHATFMPKPKSGMNGSGMHINMSLLRGEKNLFADEQDALGLSEDAYCFLGGIMRHIRSMTAVTNPIVNSYKRLVPGYGAPVDIAWSVANRSPLIRIPAFGGDGARMELRSPDPTANPYLALAAILRAGLDGIRKRISPPLSVDCNIFKLSADERQARGIEELPGTLMEAVSSMEKDAFMRETLGDHIFEKYITLKKEEWNRYRRQVTDWEISEYLNKF